MRTSYIFKTSKFYFHISLIYFSKTESAPVQLIIYHILSLTTRSYPAWNLFYQVQELMRSAIFHVTTVSNITKFSLVHKNVPLLQSAKSYTSLFFKLSTFLQRPPNFMNILFQVLIVSAAYYHYKTTLYIFWCFYTTTVLLSKSAPVLYISITNKPKI